MVGSFNQTANLQLQVDKRSLAQVERQISRAVGDASKINFGLKPGAKSPLGSIGRDINEFRGALDAANKRVIAFGASVAVIEGVRQGFVELIKTTVEVEKRLADINNILNLSSKSLEGFSKSLFDTAKNTGQSLQTAADAAVELSRQGLGAEETVKRLNDALVLSRLSGLDAAKSVEALTATINSFNKQLLSSTEIVNKFAELDARFAVSSADLAEGLQRVGSSAQEAGVSLDEVSALITSVQQTTARGGAVIGNAFKSIFTRIVRSDVQQVLNDIGVATQNADGSFRNQALVLQDLAKAYKTLPDSQKAFVAETVAGVYQSNIFKAAISDLGNSFSIYSQALDTASKATDGAIKRNEELNKTLAATANQALLNLQQIAATIGNIAIAPNLKGVLDFFNQIAGEINNVDTQSIGAKLGKGIISGIGEFVGGPGAVLLFAAVTSVFTRIAKLASGSLKDLLGMNNQFKQTTFLQQQAVQFLQQQPKILSEIRQGTMSIADAQRTYVQYLREAQILQNNIVAGTLARGLSPSLERVAAKKTLRDQQQRGFASGYMPSEKEMIQNRAYGTPATAIVKKGNVAGLGPVEYNSSERIIRDFPIKGKDSVLPTDPKRATETFKRFGFAAAGYVPNFANKIGDEKNYLRYSHDPHVNAFMIDYIRTNKRGMSSSLYEKLFTKAKGSGVSSIMGLLNPQRGNVPSNSNDPVSVLKAMFPQLIRGRYGRESLLSGTQSSVPIKLRGGKLFDEDLRKYAPRLLEEAQGTSFDYTTRLASGYVPTENLFDIIARRDSIFAGIGEYTGILSKPKTTEQLLQALLSNNLAQQELAKKKANAISDINYRLVNIDSRKQRLNQLAFEERSNRAFGPDFLVSPRAIQNTDSLNPGSLTKSKIRNQVLGYEKRSSANKAKYAKSFYVPQSSNVVSFLNEAEQIFNLDDEAERTAKFQAFNKKLNKFKKSLTGDSKINLFEGLAKIGYNIDVKNAGSATSSLLERLGKTAKIRKGGDSSLQLGLYSSGGKGLGSILSGAARASFTKRLFGKSLASGYIPNFAPKLLGEGLTAEFYKLRGKVGKKDFIDKKNTDEIENDYVFSKLVRDASLQSSVFDAPQIFGTRSRSIQRGSIGKEVVEGKTGAHLRSSFIKNDLRSMMESDLRGFGINPEDLHGNNFIIPPKLHKILDHHSFRKLYIRTGDKYQLLQKIIDRTGAKPSIIDPGFFSLLPSATSIKDRYNKYKTSAASGFVPNFANPKEILLNHLQEMGVAPGTQLPIKQRNTLQVGYFKKLQKAGLFQPTQAKALGSFFSKYVPNFADYPGSTNPNNLSQKEINDQVYSMFGNNGGSAGDSALLFAALAGVSAAGLGILGSGILEKISDKVNSGSENFSGLQLNRGGLKKLPTLSTKTTISKALGAGFQKQFVFANGQRIQKTKQGFSVYGGGSALQRVSSLEEALALVQGGSPLLNSSINKKRLRSGAFASGYIPNFAKNPIQSAVEREMAAGVPKSSIRLGFDSRVGLGVYNTKDEPAGLKQGVNRELRRGRNPKMAGSYIPNFADEGYGGYDLGTGLTGGLGGLIFALTAFGKNGENTVALQEEAARQNLHNNQLELKAAKQELNLINDRIRSIKEEGKASKDYFNIYASQAKDSSQEGAKLFREAEAKKQKALKLRSREDAGVLLQQKLEKSKSELTRIRKAAKAGKVPQSFGELEKLATLPKQIKRLERSTAKINSDISQAADLESESSKILEQAKQKRSSARSLAIQSRQYLRASNVDSLIRTEAQGRSNVENRLTNLQSLNAGLKSELRNIEKSGSFSSRLGGKLSGAGLGLSLVGPVLGGVIGSGFNQETQSGRRNATIAQGIGNIAGFAGNGAVLGSMFGGPKGAIAGTVVGAAVGVGLLTDELKKQSKSTLPDLIKNLEKTRENFTRMQDASSVFLTLLEKRKDFFDSGDFANFENANKEIAKTLISFDSEIQGQFKNIDFTDVKASQKLLSESLNKKARELQSLDLSATIESERENKTKGFFGKITSSIANAFDNSLLSGSSFSPVKMLSSLGVGNDTLNSTFGSSREIQSRINQRSNEGSIFSGSRGNRNLQSTVSSIISSTFSDSPRAFIAAANAELQSGQVGGSDILKIFSKYSESFRNNEEIRKSTLRTFQDIYANEEDAAKLDEAFRDSFNAFAKIVQSSAEPSKRQVLSKILSTQNKRGIGILQKSGVNLSGLNLSSFSENSDIKKSVILDYVEKQVSDSIFAELSKVNKRKTTDEIARETANTSFESTSTLQKFIFDLEQSSQNLSIFSDSLQEFGIQSSNIDLFSVARKKIDISLSQEVAGASEKLQQAIIKTQEAVELQSAVGANEIETKKAVLDALNNEDQARKEYNQTLIQATTKFKSEIEKINLKETLDKAFSFSAIRSLEAKRNVFNLRENITDNAREIGVRAFEAKYGRSPNEAESRAIRYGNVGKTEESIVKEEANKRLEILKIEDQLLKLQFKNALFQSFILDKENKNIDLTSDPALLDKFLKYTESSGTTMDFIGENGVDFSKINNFAKNPDNILKMLASEAGFTKDQIQKLTIPIANSSDNVPGNVSGSYNSVNKISDFASKSFDEIISNYENIENQNKILATSLKLVGEQFGKNSQEYIDISTAIKNNENKLKDAADAYDLVSQKVSAFYTISKQIELGNARTNTNRLLQSGATGDEIRNAFANQADAAFAGKNYAEFFGRTLDAQLYATWEDGVKKLADITVSTFQNIETGLTDALTGIINGTTKAEDAFKNFALSLAQDIQKQAIQGLIKQALGGIQSALANAGGGQGGSGGIGSLLGSMFSGKAKGGLIQKFASGGMVTGGSGVRDDVPAMLNSGEYVLKRSAVNKYGADFIHALNGGYIGKFATGGPTDKEYGKLFTGKASSGGFSTGFNLNNRFDLSGESNLPIGVGLSEYALTQSKLGQETIQARGEYLQSIAEYEKELKKFKSQYSGKNLGISIGTVLAGIAVSAGGNKMGQIGNGGFSSATAARGAAPYAGNISNINGRYYPRPYGYAAGGMAKGTDRVPAMLTGGEFVVNRDSVSRYGLPFMNSLNRGTIDPLKVQYRADGGVIGTANTPAGKASGGVGGNSVQNNNQISISITTNGSGQIETSVDGKSTFEGGKDKENSKISDRERTEIQKALSLQIKGAVLDVIEKESRPNGRLSQIGRR